MLEYACPNCGKRLLVHDTRAGGFKYKLVCHNCVFQDYVLDLDKLKEYIEHGKGYTD